MAPTLKLGDVSFEVQYADAGVFEDHADAVRKFVTIGHRLVESEVPYPTGEDMGAVVTLLHVLAERAGKSLTRDQVRRGITVANLGDVMRAIAWAFGFATKKDEKADAGEAGSPPSSTTPPSTSGA